MTFEVVSALHRVLTWTSCRNSRTVSMLLYGNCRKHSVKPCIRGERSNSSAHRQNPTSQPHQEPRTSLKRPEFLLGGGRLRLLRGGRGMEPFPDGLELSRELGEQLLNRVESRSNIDDLVGAHVRSPRSLSGRIAVAKDSTLTLANTLSTAMIA